MEVTLYALTPALDEGTFSPSRIPDNYKLGGTPGRYICGIREKSLVHTRNQNSGWPRCTLGFFNVDENSNSDVYGTVM